MKKISAAVLLVFNTLTFIGMAEGSSQLSDELRDALTITAGEKAQSMGLSISFAIADFSGNPLVFRAFGKPLPLRL